MEFLHMLDEYRHRGYARSLSCALVKEIFRGGRIPACHVYADNKPSLNLMDSLGLRRGKQQGVGGGGFSSGFPFPPPRKTGREYNTGWGGGTLARTRST